MKNQIYMPERSRDKHIRRKMNQWTLKKWLVNNHESIAIITILTICITWAAIG